MSKIFSVELDQEHLEYILTGLELYCLNLNSIWCFNQDNELKEEKYTNIFYLYHRLLNLATDYRVCTKMVKPKKHKKVVNNVLTFFK